MNLRDLSARWIQRAVYVALVSVVWFGPQAHAASPIPNASAVRASGRWRDASIDEYRKHLAELITLTQACARTRDLKNCDPLLVGPDDRIPFGANSTADRRLVRYGWLRVLFSKAEEPDDAAAPGQAKKKDQDVSSAQPPPPSTSKLLFDAQQRLASDVAQLDRPTTIAAHHAAERSVLALVLAGRDFQDLEQLSVRDTVLEKVNNWLNHLIEQVTRWRSRSAWVGRVLVWGFMVGVCIALVWALLQLERRWRVRLVPEQRPAAPIAPSARNWQVWLEDARRAADKGHWRDAIHFLYWASIARLETRRLWPADRARTPREYLALLTSDDPRRASLTALTGSFERVWYGGRAAAESDYRHAEEIATALIEGGNA